MSTNEPAMHIRRLLEKWVERRIILGAQVFYQHHDEECHIVAGEAASGIDATPDTVGRIYCTNKSVLAVAAGIASQEGVMTLEDRVARFFDECTPSMAEVKISDLLGHSLRLPPTLYKKVLCLDERARLIVASASLQEGGAHYNAQTTSAVLGAILEKVYSLPLERVIDEKVARPLALPNLALLPRSRRQYVPLHRRDGSMKFVPMDDEARGLHAANPGQAGVSTVADMGVLYADILSSLEGQGILLVPPTVTRLLQNGPSVQLYDFGRRSWGLGFQRDLSRDLLGDGWGPDTFGHLGTAPRRIVVLNVADPGSRRILTVRFFSAVSDHIVQQLTAIP